MKVRFCIKPLLAVAFALVLLVPQAGHCQGRDIIGIPDILGYKSLKCDFHMHTVFSDGNVWPTIRAMEAWMNGLDAISITDHVEYTPHKDDVKVDHNRSYEVARSTAAGLHVTLIKGVEVTRKMPPGHLNAIFLKDADKTDTEEWRDALEAAYDQGAFIFWNHPGWTGQQPDGIAKWYDEHTEIFDKGWVKGIEVVNSKEYYPEVHQWCLDKNLTMIGNSDVHAPIDMNYDRSKGEHRPMTIVFAKDESEEAIHEALLDRRTVVYHNNWLIGVEKFLAPIFNKTVELNRTTFTLKGKSSWNVEIANTSDLDYELELDGDTEELSVSQQDHTPRRKGRSLKGPQQNRNPRRNQNHLAPLSRYELKGNPQRRPGG